REVREPRDAKPMEKAARSSQNPRFENRPRVEQKGEARKFDRNQRESQKESQKPAKPVEKPIEKADTTSLADRLASAWAKNRLK
ncbi:MAG: hypothetical protein WAQ98_10000, partial [Blastocatellia bacterium]